MSTSLSTGPALPTSLEELWALSEKYPCIDWVVSTPVEFFDLATIEAKLAPLAAFAQEARRRSVGTILALDANATRGALNASGSGVYPSPSMLHLYATAQLFDGVLMSRGPGVSELVAPLQFERRIGESPNNTLVLWPWQAGTTHMFTKLFPQLNPHKHSVPVLDASLPPADLLGLDITPTVSHVALLTAHLPTGLAHVTSDVPPSPWPLRLCVPVPSGLV